MKFTSKVFLPVLASALLLGMNATVLAEGNHGYSNVAGVTVTRLGATLTGAAGFTGAGSFEYSDSTNGGRLQAAISLPIDGVTILDSNTAVNNVYTLTISNGASVVATYNLAINDIDFAYSTATTLSGESAEYAVSASQVGTTYTVTLGSGTSTALPVLAAGDTVSISLGGAAPILSGVLAASVGR
ncbi:MAG: hypothetical protein ABSB19_14040 [Methylomonas sp.]|jgi:hypothetical protein